MNQIHEFFMFTSTLGGRLSRAWALFCACLAMLLFGRVSIRFHDALVSPGTPGEPVYLVERYGDGGWKPAEYDRNDQPVLHRDIHVCQRHVIERLMEVHIEYDDDARGESYADFRIKELRSGTTFYFQPDLSLHTTLA